MASRKLVLLCTLLAGVGLAFAQTPQVRPGDTASPYTYVVQPSDRPDVPQNFDRAANDGYRIGIRLDGDRSGTQCVGSSVICGQNEGGNTWQYSDATLVNAYGTGRIICTPFPPADVGTITKAIGIVNWRGGYADAIGPNGDGCNKPNLFEIKFYNDVGTFPTAPNTTSPVATFTNLVPSAFPFEQITFGGAAVQIYDFTVVLPTTVTMQRGWCSIASIQPGNPAGCCHVLAPSNEGYMCFRYWQSNPNGGALQTNQVHYCFSEKRLGACCNDCTSTCTNNVFEGDCLTQGGYFLYNQQCTAVQPPCGQGTGACCHDDGTCVVTTAQVCNPNCGPSYCRGDLNCSGTVDFGDINPFVLALSDPNAYRAQFPNCPWPQNADINADGAVNFGDINPFVACLSNGGGPCAAHPPHGPCNTVAGPRAEGNVWAGRGTVCNDPNHPACCQIVCDPNMVQEGEPVCANGYVDTFDAGCNSTPASFKTITCGTTVCGNAGTYLDPNHLPVRDTDWYRVVVSSGPGVSFTFTVNAEFPVQTFVLGAGQCDPNNPQTSYFTVASATGDKCTPTVITTRVLNIGEYWFAVMPQAFSGVLCGSDYTANVVCDTTTGPCVISPPGNCTNDPEPCAYGPDTVNGGCNVTPNLFENITFDPNGAVELCGTIWAKNGTRDLDWYRFTMNSPKIVEVWWEAEFPGLCGLITGADNGHTGAPTCADGIWSCGAFDPCSGLTMCNFQVLPAGEYWPVILIQDANGAVFDGFPCGTQNRYHTRIRAYVPNCPNLITCTGGPPWGPLEGEPDCNNSYVDTFNGGCDNTASPHYLPIACDGHFCAKSGTWVNNGTPMMDTDWYSIVATGNTQYTVSVTAEFPLEFQVWKPGAGSSCTGAVMLEDYQVAACQNGPQDITLVHCLPAGTYWFRFSPQSAQIPMPCGASALNYSIWISGCTTCTPCVWSCPPGSVQEGETCGADTNGGCNATPNAFGTFNCNTTLCGQTFAAAGSRDTDWFRIVLSTPAKFNMTADTEVPLIVLLVTGTTQGHPTCLDLAGYQETGLTCQNGAGTNFVIPPSGNFPAGEYWIVVAPADASGNGIFENYPCNGGANNYWLKVLCQ